MSRYLAAALGLAAAIAVSGAPAMADSRLFSIQTDQPGVTVQSVTQNGQPLALAGESGGVSFFRIANPSGAVPCVNDLNYRLSDGRILRRTMDFCAANWDVTLAVVAPLPAPGGGGSVAGTISVLTDDPAVGIEEVYLGGVPAQIVGTNGRAVNVASGGNLSCGQDVGVVLTDGRRMARVVDICRSEGIAVIRLLEGAGGVQPVPPPVQQPVVPPIVSAPVPVLPTVGMQWLNNRGNDRASLTYGVPETDAGELTAVCDLGSGSASMILTRTDPSLVPGGTVSVRFQAGGFAGSYQAAGTRVSELSGQSHPRLNLQTGDSLWQALIRENEVTIWVGSTPGFVVSLKGSAVKVREFLSWCNPAPAVPPPSAPAPGNYGEIIAFACDDGRALSAAFDNSADIVTVFGVSATPLVLRRTQSTVGARYVSPLAELVGLEESITWRYGGGFSTCWPR